MSAHEQEPAPERLSAEWHARECDKVAEEGRKRARFHRSGWSPATCGYNPRGPRDPEAREVAAKSWDADAEAQEDRAAKLRRLAEVEALLRDVYETANRALWVRPDSIERWENGELDPRTSRSTDEGDWIKLGKAIIAAGNALTKEARDGE